MARKVEGTSESRGPTSPPGKAIRGQVCITGCQSNHLTWQDSKILRILQRTSLPLDLSLLRESEANEGALPRNLDRKLGFLIQPTFRKTERKDGFANLY